jgi:hypothetical protein
MQCLWIPPEWCPELLCFSTNAWISAQDWRGLQSFVRQNYCATSPSPVLTLFDPRRPNMTLESEVNPSSETNTCVKHENTWVRSQNLYPVILSESHATEGSEAEVERSRRSITCYAASGNPPTNASFYVYMADFIAFCSYLSRWKLPCEASKRLSSERAGDE